MSDRTDPRAETIQTAIPSLTPDTDRIERAYEALASLAREAQLARAVVEAAEQVERRGNPMGILGPLLVALDAYRAEFPQEST